MGRWLPGAVVFTLLAVLAGCSPPPPPPPTVVKLTLTATPDVNPDQAGHGAPLAINVYQLTSTSTFDAAEFFPLFNDDKGTLKDTLVGRDQFILAPGTTKTVTLKPKDQVTALSFFAAYRDFQNAKWRAETDVPPHKTTKVSVSAGRSGLTVKSGS